MRLVGAGVLTIGLVGMMAARCLPGRESGTLALLIARPDAGRVSFVASTNLAWAVARLRRTVG
ncbi:MAG: hypothetical protein ACIAXF_06910 [Phycisphaerales bacterium JB063]